MSNEFTQGDYTFYISPMDPFLALELLGDLQKTFLPAIGAAFGKSDMSEEKKNVTMADLLSRKIDIQSALIQLSGAINGINLKNMLQRILNSDYIRYEQNGDVKKLDKVALMSIYNGNLSGMFELAWKVLQVNYADFFTMFPGPSGLGIENVKAMLSQDN
jgi:hypothetical protein